MHDPDPVERAASVSALGLAGRISDDVAETIAETAAADPDPHVRAAALGALVRGARRSWAAGAWRAAAADPDPAVRRRSAEVAPALGRGAPIGVLQALLADPEPLVAEAAAFALGERSNASAVTVALLARAANEHDDPLVREASVAALGAIGDDRGLPAILRACEDRPAIRRRAVIALAAFEGDEVDAALRAALDDHDWQVRQAAEDLLAE